MEKKVAFDLLHNLHQREREREYPRCRTANLCILKVPQSGGDCSSQLGREKKRIEKCMEERCLDLGCGDSLII